MPKKATLFLLCVHLCLLAAGQGTKITVKGTVTDDGGQPLPGLTVLIQDTQEGTVTDLDGHYTIKAPAAATLLFDCMGFVQVREPVRGRKVIDVQMEPDNNVLDEVVVVGYGTMKRTDLTGSVASVSAKNLENFRTGSVVDALGGQIAGVSITSDDGAPGSGSNIVIRGVGTVNGDASPLYVVDGFEVDNIDFLANQDIASVEVLKDASASAIYGARAANGVVLVTTKSGREGRMTVSYNGSASFRTLSKRLPVLSPYEYVRLQHDLDKDNDSRYFREGANDAGVPYRYQTMEDYLDVAGINWQDQAFRNTWSQTHDISIRGGTSSSKYTASYSHFDENGIFVNSGYVKDAARVKFNNTLSKWLTMDVNVSYTRQRKYGLGTSGYVLRNIIGYRPTGGLKTPDDVLLDSAYDPDDENSYNDHFNPVAAAYTTDSERMTRTWMANGSLDFKIAKGLTLKTSGSYYESLTRNDSFNYAESQSAKRSGGAYGQSQMQFNNNWSVSNVLTYEHKFNKKHKVVAMLGQEFTFNGMEYLRGQAKEFPIDVLGNDQLGIGTPSLVETSRTEKNRLSFFVRGFYSFRDRYMVTATLRADGSSVFAAGNRWGIFPSVSTAWTLSNEPWMAFSKEWLDNLKIRAGWGTVGNDRISSYLSSDLYTNAKYGHGAAAVPVLLPRQLANPDLKWEGASTLNLGLDVSALHSRLNLTADAFIKDTKDLLLAQNLAYVTGWGSQWQNIGKIRNKGVELSLNAIAVNRAHFSWTLDANISFIRNTLLSLQDGTPYMLVRSGFDSNNTNYDYIALVGKALGNMYGFVWDGVYQYSDFDIRPDLSVSLKEGVTDNSTQLGETVKPGYIKYKDQDGDFKITDKDRTVIGNGYPDWFGGFASTFHIYDFDLSAVFQYSYGNDVFNITRFLTTKTNNKSRNMLAEVSDRWTATHASNAVPSLKGYAMHDLYSRYIEDGSYLRLKNLTLGYTLPHRLSSRIRVSKWRLYVTATNLFCLTRYGGYDPEVNSNSSPLMPGMDASSYPKNTAYIFGMELKL